MMRLLQPPAWLNRTRLLFHPNVYRGLLFVAVGLSLAMALMSTTNKQVHHDEYDHINAARFYFHNWLPPAVADPRTLDSYSIFGMSYLNEWDIVYLLAGKFAMLIHPVVHNDAIALRLFNVALFLILACIALFRRNYILAFAILLTSPQIWYMFSYFDGDAFPMFLSMLTAGALTSSQSLFNDRTRSTIIRYLPLGICIGLLILSKKTFWAFGLFAVICAAWLELAHYGRTAASAGPFFKSMAVLAAIILITALPRISYDFYVNGTPWHKASKITETAESLAAPIFKPSNPSKASLNLRGKGVTVLDMMKPPLNWGFLSVATAFGTYNYNTFWSHWRYYRAIICIYALFLIYLIFVVSKYGDINDTVLLSCGLLFSYLIVGLAVYHSWVNDFQPQGRYLFGIFAILAVILARTKHLLNPLAVGLFVSCCFLLSAYSFVHTGLGNVSEFKDLTEISKDFRRP